MGRPDEPRARRARAGLDRQQAQLPRHPQDDVGLSVEFGDEVDVAASAGLQVLDDRDGVAIQFQDQGRPGIVDPPGPAGGDDRAPQVGLAAGQVGGRVGPAVPGRDQRDDGEGRVGRVGHEKTSLERAELEGFQRLGRLEGARAVEFSPPFSAGDTDGAASALVNH